MKKVRKALALLLTVSMIFGTAMSVSATGITENELDETVTEEHVPSDVTNQGTVDAETPQPQDVLTEETPLEGTGENEEIPVENAETVVEEAVTYAAAPDVPVDASFRRVFHVDAGRKYFSVADIKGIIDILSKNNYSHLELALGNDGLRFLLDDMTVNANGKTYASGDVTNGIKQGNRNYAHAGEYSQAEMDEILAYAQSKQIEIIPLINTPGHMDAILDCMKVVGIQNAAFNNSSRTVDVTNQEAVNFTVALLEKYAAYFGGKGCTMFNMGCDEYANDVSNGFNDLIRTGKYNDFATYVNRVANVVKTYNMIPIAFNDGIYYNRTETTPAFDSNIVISYWTTGWNGYNPASADFLAQKGHKILNTNDAWYYVLGRRTGTYPLSNAEKGIQNTSCTSVPGGLSNSDALIGSMVCLWCDEPNVPYNTDEVANVDNIATTFAQNNQVQFAPTTKPDPVPPTPDPGPTVPPTTNPSEKVIEVAVGLTAEDIIKGSDFSGQVNKTQLDTAIADANADKVSATVDAWELVTNGAAGVNTTDEYVVATAKADGTVQLLTNAGGQTAVTVTGGKIETGVTNNNIFKFETNKQFWNMKDINGKYLYPSASNRWGWTYSLETGKNSSYSIAITGNEAVKIHRKVSGLLSNTESYINYTGSGFSANNTGSNLYLFKKVSKPAGVDTKVTFEGKAPGTTYVTVGNVKYTIIVTERVPQDAMTENTLTVEYWITNNNVHVQNDLTSAKSVQIQKTEASTEEGLAIDTKAVQVGYSDYDGWITLNYWQAMRLDSAHHQTGGAGVDQTAAGTAMTHVRWKNNAWQYKTADGVWNYFMQGDQAVAYYMRHTAITKEITTAMKDWGYNTNADTDNTSGGKGQVALTVAVVYPDGTVSPTESNMYQKSTTVFNFWEGRDIGIIAPLNNSDYDIAKMTVTDGTRTRNKSDVTWHPDDSITWNKKTTVAGTQWYNETEIWNDTMGTKPVVNGAASNITWPAKNTAKLVLIYLKPVHKETNLVVRWVDDSASGALIKQQEVVVAHTATEPVTFLNGLKNNNKPVHAGTIELDNAAYITNSSGVNQTFNKDLTTMQGIDGQYASGLYQYTSADISVDGKVLTLHYNLDQQSLNKQYVMDFGLQVEVPLADLVENVANVTGVTTTANASYDSASRKIIFKPTKTLTGIETVRANVQYATGNPQSFSIGFVPATTVYYEEGFATLTGFTDGSTGTGVQATEAVKTKKHNYGYDPNADLNQVGPSNGTQATSSAYGDGAVFTFVGTGVDIYANSDTTTGQLFVQVKNSAGKTVKMIQVKTAMLNGTSGSTEGQNVAAYNVPVVSLDLQARDTYTVTIKHMKSSATATGDVVNLDGFKVYGTLAGDTYAYTQNNEANPVFAELRDHVLAGLNVNTATGEYASQIARDVLSQVYSTTGVTNGAVVLDASGNTTTDVQDLLNNGPKNELYLRPNQSVTFKLKQQDAQIGLKALNAAVTYSVNNGDNATLNASTDMFYPIQAGVNGSVTITNKSQGTAAILSVTKIKAVNGNAVVMMDLTEEDLVPAVMSLGVGSEPEPPVEPQPPVQPEIPMADAVANVNLVDYAGNVLETTAIAVNGQEGSEVVIAGAELQAAAEQLLPKGYAFVEEPAVADVTVVCGQTAEVNLQIGKLAILKVTYKTLFGRVAGTATLTAVQKSADSSYKFSAQELKDAAPGGYWTGTLIPTKVNYGSVGTRTVIGF